VKPTLLKTMKQYGNAELNSRAETLDKCVETIYPASSDEDEDIVHPSMKIGDKGHYPTDNRHQHRGHANPEPRSYYASCGSRHHHNLGRLQPQAD